jgi:Uma2 family endonuclease
MTTATTDPTRLLTAEEYGRMPDDGRFTELVRGRIVELTPPLPYHGFVCTNAIRLLDTFVRAQKRGRVMANDSGVITERQPDTVRGADVCFYSYERLPPGPFAEEEYLTVTPDLVMEVRSPSNRRGEILRKVAEYLAANVTVVCVINPKTLSAVVYRNDQEDVTVAEDEALTFPDVLPGFRVSLKEFFE